MSRCLLTLVVVLMGWWCLTGGIHWATSMGLSVLTCLGAVVVGVWGARHRRDALGEPVGRHVFQVARFHGFGVWGWMLLGLIAWTTLTLIPMPLAVIEVLSPTAAQWYRESWALLSIDRSWGFLTVSWGRTCYALWILCGFFGLYAMTLRIAHSRASIQWISHALAFAGCVWVAAYALRFAGVNLSFGELGASSPYHLGLPVNANHASAVLVLLSMISLGAFLSRRHKDALARRALWGIFCVAFGVAIVMLQSRGALFAWLCGNIAVMTFVWVRTRQVGWRACGMIVGGLGAIMLTVFVLAAPSLGSIKNEIETADIAFDATQAFYSSASEGTSAFSKTRLYADFIPMSQDWWRTGTGRSAFADAYPAYQSFGFAKRFRHAENEYWELILEYGWILGIAVIAALWAGWWSTMRVLWKAPHERQVIFGFLGGIAAVLLHNLLDFNLRYWTAGFVFWMSCGVVQARAYRWKFGRYGEDHSDISRARRIEWGAGYAILIVGMLAALCTARAAVEGQTETRLHQLPAALAAAPDGVNAPELLENMTIRMSRADVRERVAEFLVRLHHPDDPRPSWQRAQTWLESAQHLDPHSASIALRLGKVCLALEDPKCAAQNYARAAQVDPRQIVTAMSEMAALPTDDIVFPLAPDAQRALISALLARQRVDAALALVSSLDDATIAPELYVRIYRAMDFEDGAREVLAQLKNYPMSLSRFRLESEELIRQKDYPSLMTYLKSSEADLNHEPEYWRMRLYDAVWYGKVLGDAEYRDHVSTLLLKFRAFASQSSTWQFDLALCESKFALEIGQIPRAIRAARRALSIKPGHREAERILKAAHAK